MTTEFMDTQATGQIPDYKGLQFWRNPEDGLVYAGGGEPSYGFHADKYFFPVFDPQIRVANLKALKKATQEGQDIASLDLPSPYIDDEFHEMFLNWKDNFMAGGRQRLAALSSPSNSAVNILNVFPKVFGLAERQHAATELAEKIAIPNLVIDIDTLTKFSGMAEIAELQIPHPKEIRYTRAHYEAKKYGLVFEISEESILKNVHNPLQDSITVAGTKVDQRKAYDVVQALEDGTISNVAATNAYDTFVSGTDRSTTNPKKDIQRIVVNSIEGTGNGGTFSVAGMHQITNSDYETNSFLRGFNEPAPDPQMPAGTKPLRGFNGVTLVMDQFIPQGIAYVLDKGNQTCCALFEGPTRVAQKTDQITNSEIYGIFDFHLAAIINSNFGKRITGVATPVAPPA